MKFFFLLLWLDSVIFSTQTLYFKCSITHPCGFNVIDECQSKCVRVLCIFPLNFCVVSVTKVNKKKHNCISLFKRNRRESAACISNCQTNIWRIGSGALNWTSNYLTKSFVRFPVVQMCPTSYICFNRTDAFCKTKKRRIKLKSLFSFRSIQNVLDHSSTQFKTFQDISLK